MNGLGAWDADTLDFVRKSAGVKTLASTPPLQFGEELFTRFAISF